MLNNRRDDIRRMVTTMRHGPLINEISVFGPGNTVAFSSNKEEDKGRSKDPDLDSVFATGKTRTRYETRYGNDEFCMRVAASKLAQRLSRSGSRPGGSRSTYVSFQSEVDQAVALPVDLAR